MTELSRRAKEILEMLRAGDDWLSRKDLATIMNKKRLNSHEVNLLEVLVDEGLIERDIQPIGITEKYVYRINTEN